MTDRLTKYWWEGVEARKRGQPQSSCPHDPRSEEASRWRTGWANNPPRVNGAVLAATLSRVKPSPLSRIYTSWGVSWALITPEVLARVLEEGVSKLNEAYGRILLSHCSLTNTRRLGTIFNVDRSEAYYQEALRQVQAG